MPKDNDIHTYFMLKALQIAQKGRYLSPPNPWVGCILVKGGEIISEGYTHAPGCAHAEVDALQKARMDTNGATAYVTLEPCAHQGRTPPCVDALIKAGIKEVYIAIEDPDIRVKGKGIKTLKEAGISVVLGTGHREVEENLRSYLYHRKTNSPYCIAKTACSIDGRIAAEDGSSKWISSEEARLDAQILRAESQAILIGSRTAQIDLPRLTVRTIENAPQPLRVLLDSRGTTLPKGPLFDHTQGKLLIFTSKLTQESRIEEWKNQGADIEITPLVEDKLDLKEILSSLGKGGILQVLIEGGSTLQTNFYECQLLNEWRIYLGNCFLGVNGKPLTLFSIDNMERAPRLELKNSKILGQTVRLDYTLPNN